MKGKARIQYKLPLVSSNDFIPEVQKHNESKAKDVF